jgi:Lon protease-like protein
MPAPLNLDSSGLECGMRIPAEVPVMTLPHATLFPGAVLPLFIFEPRYRKMLAEALATHRLLVVAGLRPGSQREEPEAVAGLGVIRVSVDHEDGTSHLLLQGVARVRLQEAIRHKPYRVHRVEHVGGEQPDSVVADALMARVRELVEELLKLGVKPPLALSAEHLDQGRPPTPDTGGNALCDLESLQEPGILADLVANALLQDSGSRQMLLEAGEVEARLRQLIQFLLADIRQRRKSKPHE